MTLKKLIEAKNYNNKIIKAKIISAEGSVPRNQGTFMLISENNIYGSIGGGQLEYNIINKSYIRDLKEKNEKSTIFINEYNDFWFKTTICCLA